MKTTKQIKAIASQLEVLEELKEQFECLIADIDTVTTKGKSWIDDSDSQHFLDMNFFLTNETARCLQRCRELTNDVFDQRSDTAENSNQAESTTAKTYHFRSKDDKRFQSLCDKVAKIDSTILKHSKKIKKLEQKSFEQETKIDSTLEQVQENETQNDSKFEELINELQAASEFLTNLQNQNKKLSEKVQENNEQMRELLSTTETYGHLPQELANQKERLESFQQVNESEYKGLVIKMEEFIQGHSATSNQLNTNYEHLLNLVEANKTELSQLKTCISNDALSNIKEMCTDRDEHVKRIERKLKETSDRNRKKNVNLNTKIQANKETTSRLQVKFKSLQKKVTGNFNTTKLLIRPLKSSISEIVDQFSTYKSHTQELELMKSKMTTAEGEILKLSNDHSKLLNSSPRDVMAACRLQINDSKVMNFKKETILTCFNSCLLNIGNCYNRNTGIFTAPCNGLYLCSLMLESENFVAEKFLIYDRKSVVESKRGTTHTNKTNAVACLVTVLLLNQGDEIYIKPANDIAKIKLSSSSYFLCVLLQQN